ncbi:YcbK family protein [Azospirillum thermophilum]|nr:DUF882 domain-containing protein [Azospirillum thermophilum]
MQPRWGTGVSMRGSLRAVFACLLAAIALAGCASTPGTGGLGDGPRSVVLTHPGSGEMVSVTYWRPGGYDADALRQISMLFRDRRTGEVVPVDPALIDMLVELRQRCGAASDMPIRVTSGYRSAATNAALARSNGNVAENSYHMRGQAADFSIPGVAPSCLGEAAAEMRRGGYAVYPHTGHVHVDTGPFRTWTPKGGEPRTSPAILEAKASPRPKPAAAPPVQVADVPAPAPEPAPPPARQAAAAVPAAGAAAKTKPAEPPRTGTVRAPAPPPDLTRVRYVLAQLKQQPAPAPRGTKDGVKP